MVEATGEGRRASVRLPSTRVQSAALADLLEVPRTPLDVDAGSIHVDLAGSDIQTVVARVTAPSSSTPVVIGAEQETAQPVFSRYWLHNRGPAPMGFLPVSVALTPLLARAQPGGVVEVNWVVSSQYADASVDVDTGLELPAGWSASFLGTSATLAPSGYGRFRSSLVLPADAEPGQYAVAAWVRRRSVDRVAEVVEDVATVFVGDSPTLVEALGFALPTAADLGRDVQFGTREGDRPRPTGLTLDVDTTSVRVAAGGSATLLVRLGNQTRSQIRGELQLASPWGTWTWVREASRGFRIEPGATLDLVVEVSPPSDTAPGHSWVLPKVMWFGRAQYAPTVRIEVGS